MPREFLLRERDHKPAFRLMFQDVELTSAKIWIG
jgi:hypothetical protein